MELSEMRMSYLLPLSYAVRRQFAENYKLSVLKSTSISAVLCASEVEDVYRAKININFNQKLKIENFPDLICLTPMQNPTKM